MKSRNLIQGIISFLFCTLFTWNVIATNQIYGFVMSGQDLNQLLKPCSRNAPEYSKIWRPTKKIIRKMESEFPLQVEGYNLEKMDHYILQYSGLVRGGKKFVYVSGLKISTENNPGNKEKHHAIIICDGGSGIFGMEYDVKERKFLNLQFNGGF